MPASLFFLFSCRVQLPSGLKSSSRRTNGTVSTQSGGLTERQIRAPRMPDPDQRQSSARHQVFPSSLLKEEVRDVFERSLPVFAFEARTGRPKLKIWGQRPAFPHKHILERESRRNFMTSFEYSHYREIVSLPLCLCVGKEQK